MERETLMTAFRPLHICRKCGAVLGDPFEEGYAGGYYKYCSHCGHTNSQEIIGRLEYLPPVPARLVSYVNAEDEQAENIPLGYDVPM